MFRKKEPKPSAPPPPPPAAPSQAEAARALRRENQRAASSAKRTMDGELRRLKAEESKLKMEMRSLARAGKVTEARVLAKNLAQNQAFQKRCMTSKYQVDSVANQGSMALAQQSVAAAMGQTVGIMARVNEHANPAGTMAMAQQYEMEASKAEMNSEMMDDALESAFGGVEVDAESDNILNEVLVEAGLEVGSQLGAAGPTPAFVPNQAAREEQDQQQRLRDESADIERRLNALGGTPSGNPGAF